jgi:hypothetical protein
MNLEEETKPNFNSGYNCAESVSLAVRFRTVPSRLITQQKLSVKHKSLRTHVRTGIA